MDPLDVVACEASMWVCLLEQWGGEPALWLAILGFLSLCAGVLWYQWREELTIDAVRQRARPPRKTRIVAGPELRDGSWVRLVEYAPGHLRAEVYSERRWVVLHRDPSKFFEAAPRDDLRLPTR